jgi:hypothetical protein
MSSRANGGSNRGLRGFDTSGGDGGGAGRGKGRGAGKGKAAIHDSSSSVVGRDSVRRVGRSKVRRNAEDAVESKLGYEVFSEGEARLGWLITLSPVSHEKDAHTDSLSLSLTRQKHSVATFCKNYQAQKLDGYLSRFFTICDGSRFLLWIPAGTNCVQVCNVYCL